MSDLHKGDLTNHKSLAANHKSRVTTHKDLDVWRKAVDLSVDVYQFTKEFPREEMYAMSSQMRRAAISIPSNIAEGAARRTDKDFIHFLYIALGSASELDTQCEIGCRIGLLDEASREKLQRRVEEVSKMLYGLIRSVRGKQDG